MRSSTKIPAVLFVALLLSLSVTAFTHLAAQPPADPGALQPAGINIDALFDIDPICGFQIILSGAKPVNTYTGSRNPWGAPTITELFFPGSNVWLLTFGGPNGPCFSRYDPIFWENGVFVGLHFGFLTDDPIVKFFNVGQTVQAPCWFIGQNGSVPCNGITGHQIHGGFLQVSNANDQVLAVRNVEIAVSPNQIAINELRRNDLGRLDWETLPLDDAFLPAGSNDAPGTLDIRLPVSVLSQAGWGVVSYDVANPETGEVYSRVTLEFPLN